MRRHQPCRHNTCSSRSHLALLVRDARCKSLGRCSLDVSRFPPVPTCFPHIPRSVPLCDAHLSPVLGSREGDPETDPRQTSQRRAQTNIKTPPRAPLRSRLPGGAGLWLRPSAWSSPLPTRAGRRQVSRHLSSPYGRNAARLTGKLALTAVCGLLRYRRRRQLGGATGRQSWTDGPAVGALSGSLVGSAPLPGPGGVSRHTDNTRQVGGQTR